MITLTGDEKIVLVLRRHIVWLFMKAASFLFLLLGPLAIYFVLYAWRERLPWNLDIFGAVFLFALSIFYLFLWMNFFIEFLNFWLDVWVITDKKIIIINQLGLFRRDISEIPISKIQDIKVSISGFLQTAINYGDLSVRTASEEISFVLEDIANPEKVKKVLLSHIHRHI